MTYARRKDANHGEIVKALRVMGLPWFEFPPLDGWTCDGEWIPVEIKMPHRAAHKNRFTPAESAFLKDAEFYHGPVLIAESADDIYRYFTARRRRRAKITKHVGITVGSAMGKTESLIGAIEDGYWSKY